MKILLDTNAYSALMRGHATPSELDIHIMSVYRGTVRGGGTNAMHRRINITLPEETVKLIDRVAPKGDRSRLIAAAVVQYVQTAGRSRLRRQLREGARRRAERDLALAREWFALDEEAWRRSER